MGDDDEARFLGTQEENPCADFPKGKRFGNWQIVSHLGEGGFGQVYKVENIKDPGKVAALKAEPNDVEGGSAIKLEMLALRTINADGDKMHVPTVYHAAKHKRFCYMIMTLLGVNLDTLKLICPGERMPPSAWSRLAVQCLYAIKIVHDYGFVHRDIKPNNFVMGDEDDVERARIVYILDFGLARSYAMKKGGKWVARRARSTAEFRGTLRFCSPNVHMKIEQGRRDDLWGLLYVLIDFHCGLPWQKAHIRKVIEVQKTHISDEELMKRMPPECKNLPAGLRALDCYGRPNYTEWANAFKAIYTKLNVQYWDKYPWESQDQLNARKEKLNGKLPQWMTDGDAFFASDPIKINGPPPRQAASKGSIENQDTKSRQKRQKSTVSGEK